MKRGERERERETLRGMHTRERPRRCHEKTSYGLEGIVR